nr:MAG TPA: hypothetical protein [Caudoviricetes sp.]
MVMTNRSRPRILALTVYLSLRLKWDFRIDKQLNE